MRVLGLDLSTATGAAVVDQDKKVLFSEQIQFKNLSGWPRCAAIAGRILGIYEQYKPDMVVIEGYGFANSNSLATLVEIGSIVRYFLWQEGIVPFDVPPNSLKSFVTGKGQSKKEMMILEVYKNWGFTSPTNDIADAVGLGMFGLCCAGVPFSAAAKKTCSTVVKGQPAFVAHLRKSGIQCN